MVIWHVLNAWLNCAFTKSICPALGIFASDFCWSQSTQKRRNWTRHNVHDACTGAGKQRHTVIQKLKTHLLEVSFDFFFTESLSLLFSLPENFDDKIWKITKLKFLPKNTIFETLQNKNVIPPQNYHFWKTAKNVISPNIVQFFKDCKPVYRKQISLLIN